MCPSSDQETNFFPSDVSFFSSFQSTSHSHSLSFPFFDLCIALTLLDPAISLHL
jgi:hypothetical protein